MRENYNITTRVAGTNQATTDEYRRRRVNEGERRREEERGGEQITCCDDNGELVTLSGTVDWREACFNATVSFT